MQLPLPPFAQLERLSSALEDAGDDLQAMLAVLIDDLTAAVPSFTGLKISIPTFAEPVTVAAVDPAVSRASMLLPLHLITDAPQRSVLVFYAAEPGAFRSLAADTRATYGVAGQVQLDRHLPPPADADGTGVMVEGAEQRSIINQAIGVLLDRGHLPEEAAAVLAARSAAANLPLPAVAQQLLDGLAGPGSPDRAGPGSTPPDSEPAVFPPAVPIRSTDERRRRGGRDRPS